MRGSALRGCLAVVAGAVVLVGTACGGTATPRAGEALDPEPRAPIADVETEVAAPSPETAALRCEAPIEVVVYAQDDWIGLARTFAAAPPGCVVAWIGVPTEEGRDRAWLTTRPHMKEQFARIGSNVHPMPTVDFDDWQAWGRAHPGVSWRERGVMARRGMEAAGYDFAAGDIWALNEVPIDVETDPSTRTAVRDLLTGLEEGSAGPTGVAYAVIPVQAEGSIAQRAEPLRPLFADRSFWVAANRALLAWSDEAYADVRTTCEPGASYERQADALMDYAFARRSVARAASEDAAPEARSMLERTVPLANAAWRWTEDYGWTDVPVATMADFVRVQIHAMSRPYGSPDRIFAGFAWAPRSAPRAGLARIAAAVRDELVTIASQPMRDTPPPCSWPGARIAG